MRNTRRVRRAVLAMTLFVPLFVMVGAQPAEAVQTTITETVTLTGESGSRRFTNPAGGGFTITRPTFSQVDTTQVTLISQKLEWNITATGAFDRNVFSGAATFRYGDTSQTQTFSRSGSRAFALSGEITGPLSGLEGTGTFVPSAVTGSARQNSGLFPWNASFTDVSGTVTLTVVVDDSAPPVWSVPADITTSTDPGLSTAAVTYVATASDPSGVASESCTPASGSPFPVGTTPVQCTAEDALSNANSPPTTFNVTVEDNEPPVWVVADVTQGTDPGLTSAVVNFVATATDNVAVAASSCTSTSGSMFLLGPTTVMCTATDAAGNVSGAASFDVTVVDDEPPAAPVVVNPPTTVSTDLGSATAMVTYAVPTPVDNAPDATVSCVPASGSAFAIGDTTVTCTAIDAAGNTTPSSFVVTVEDNEVPTTPVVVNPPGTVMTDSGASTATVTYAVPAPVDNAPGATVSCVPASDSAFAIGDTTVTCTTTDAAGNTSGATSFVVTVEDNEAPTAPVVANPPGTVSTDSGASTAEVTYSVTATDNVGVVGEPSCTPPSGSAFAIGDTTVTCTATDAAGNTSGATSFVVTVEDDEPPAAPVVVDPPGTVPTDPGASTAVVTYVVPPAVDNARDATVSCVPASDSAFAIGDTTVTCTATDAAGNSTPSSFVVTVEDDEPPAAPVVNPPGTASTDPNASTAVVTYTSPTPVDNAPGATVSCVPASGSVFALGVTTVTCVTTDAAGNTSGATTFDVTVEDTEPPAAPVVVNPPGAVSTDPGASTAVVTYVVPTPVDNAPDATVSCVPASGSAFAVGVTTVTCTTTDAAGNTSGATTFDVSVEDTEPPTWTEQPDIEVRTRSTTTLAVDFGIAAFDNAGLDTSSCSPASGSRFAVAQTHTVTCTATDNAGNEATTSFTIRVVGVADVGVVLSQPDPTTTILITPAVKPVVATSDAQPNTDAQPLLAFTGNDARSAAAEAFALLSAGFLLLGIRRSVRAKEERT